jgi:hypothetical protein
MGNIRLPIDKVIFNGKRLFLSGRDTVQVFSSRQFKWSNDKAVWSNDKAVSSLTDLGLASFPREFVIRSERSGRERRFVIDAERMVENEFYDGEASAYEADNISVLIWV